MTALDTFLFGFPLLFAVVNPIGMAFIFDEIAADLTTSDRNRLAGRISIYVLVVILVSLWGGALLLEAFGISLGALRIAGGGLVAVHAWRLLESRSQYEKNVHVSPAEAARRLHDQAFFPLTIPISMGPGTIATAIAIGAAHPAAGKGLFGFVVGTSAAVLGISFLIWFSYRYTALLTALLGDSGRQVFARLFAFILLCVGMQIIVTGVVDIASGIVSS